MWELKINIAINIALYVQINIKYPSNMHANKKLVYSENLTLN